MPQAIMQIVHDTIVIERRYAAAASEVFAAFADPQARTAWGIPSDTAVLIYDAADFRTGGQDLFRCGAKSDPKYHGETRYLAIRKDRQIVYVETIDADGSRLSASLVTVELSPLGDQTKLKLTAQVTAFGGSEMIEGSRFGHGAALTNLERFLRKAG